MDYKYPIYKESAVNGAVFKFTGMREGTCVKVAIGTRLGTTATQLYDHVDKHWKDTDFREDPTFNYYIKSRK